VRIDLLRVRLATKKCCTSYIRSTVPRVAVIGNPLSASVVELPTSSFAVHRLTVPSVLSWASSAIEECTRYRLEVFHPKAFGQIRNRKIFEWVGQ
jgi:hypothetical protein